MTSDWCISKKQKIERMIREKVRQHRENVINFPLTRHFMLRNFIFPSQRNETGKKKNVPDEFHHDEELHSLNRSFVFPNSSNDWPVWNDTITKKMLLEEGEREEEFEWKMKSLNSFYSQWAFWWVTKVESGRLHCKFTSCEWK